MDEDPTNPAHYRSHPSGVECIAITEHMSFCRGNAVKYLWRATERPGREVEDLRKAVWYLEREIQRLSGAPSAHARPVEAFANALARESADAPIPYRPTKRGRK